MPRCSLWLSVAALSSACTIIYNPDNLPPATDAQVFDARPIDADPDQLTLTRVEPATLLEGGGAGGGRPVLLVLKGSSLIGGATVTAVLEGGGPDQPEVDGFDAVPDGTEGGLSLRIPVLSDLAAGVPRALHITVTQDSVAQTIDASVMGLAELTLPADGTVAMAGVQTYSRITVSGATHFTGTTPVRLAATADVVLMANLDVNAANKIPGPGGCPGGDHDAPGTCTPGGGAGGVNAAALGLGNGSGGAGGGFGTAGTMGQGADGAVGAATGNDMLVPIVGGVANDELNHGNGGGGGGAGLLNAVGGVGGGGGGVLSLSAGGDIVIEGARVDATGGNGTAGANNTCGGGASGSGGAILIRAGGMITSTGAWLGAAAGTTATSPTNDGGAGGVGRIRVDNPAAPVRDMAVPGALRGPAWPPSTPVVVAAPPAVTLTGEPGRAFQIRLNDADAGMATPGAGGTTPVLDLAWGRGKNHLCAVARPNQLSDESLACIDVYVTAP